VAFARIARRRGGEWPFVAFQLLSTISNSAAEAIKMPQIITSAVRLDDPGSSTAGRTLWIM